MDQITKVCARCKGELPISQFWRDRYQKDGKHRLCQACAMADKRRNQPKYAARYHIYRLVKRGLLPKPTKLQCVVPGCTRTDIIYHHYLGYAREHWEHVLPICRHHNARRFHEQESLWTFVVSQAIS